MCVRKPFAVVAILLAVVMQWAGPSAPRAQAPEQKTTVIIDILGTPGKKINIAVPEFAVVSGTDSAGAAKLLASVTGSDLTFSGLFSVVAGTGAIPPNNPAMLAQSWQEFAASGAHAGLHGLLAVRSDRLEGEMRLYDLTTPEHRLIATKKFETPIAQPRRLAHKIADEVVLQFTGEPGIADTKLAYVTGPRGAKEIVMADYDGIGPAPVTRNGSINLMPVWSPDARSLAYTSYKQGYPDLYRAFPFERRPEQTLAAFVGINSSPAFSPDGKSLALTLSKDGNPEIYVLTLATGTMRRLTRNAGIDTEPTWAPSGRQLAFVSDRNGAPNVYVMDAEGTSVRQLTAGGFHTQPRWSPKGDSLVYTARQGVHDLWIVNVDGSNPRKLTDSAGDSQGATWAPNGRHLAFQSNRNGRWQIFAMLADGSAPELITRGPGDSTSPSWSPRLP
ncbi:MAG: Tol-Pal system beta propeller repeat protein TolB [Candidatus Rokuibacteriota bacterium]|nr:MAG: Tol-Pal system beta propeller repeat protein TolB [Candidatus Rokubacteria bacterium]